MPSTVFHAEQATQAVNKVKLPDFVFDPSFVEKLKISSTGPDSLFVTSPRTFYLQHMCSPKEFFQAYLTYIKENHLETNSDVIANFFGHLSHFIVDAIFHPWIYYVTYFSGLGLDGELKSDRLLNYHILFELGGLDFYAFNKAKEFNSDSNKSYKSDSLSNYFSKVPLIDRKLIQLLNKVYLQVYNMPNIGFKFIPAYFTTELLQKVSNLAIVGSAPVAWTFGNFYYSDDKLDKVQFILDKNQSYIHPVTGIETSFDFRNEWFNALNEASEIIELASGVLYGNSSIEDFGNFPRFSRGDSYDTGDTGGYCSVPLAEAIQKEKLSSSGVATMEGFRIENAKNYTDNNTDFDFLKGVTPRKKKHH